MSDTTSMKVTARHPRFRVAVAALAATIGATLLAGPLHTSLGGDPPASPMSHNAIKHA